MPIWSSSDSASMGWCLRPAVQRNPGAGKWRIACALALASWLFVFMPAWAQQAQADLPPEKARQFLDLLSDPELKAWLERKIPAVPTEPEVSIAGLDFQLASCRTRSRRCSRCGHAAHP